MVSDRSMSPTRVAALLSERPARHFGLLSPQGRVLIPGGDADFIVVEPTPLDLRCRKHGLGGEVEPL